MTPAAGLEENFLGQPGLADPRLATDEHEASAPLFHCVEAGEEIGDLLPASHNGLVRASNRLRHLRIVRHWLDRRHRDKGGGEFGRRREPGVGFFRHSACDGGVDHW